MTSITLALRTIFARPGKAGSIIRNGMRAVIPLLQVFGVIHWSGDQVAQVIVSTEALFFAGGTAADKIGPPTPQG